MNVKPILDDMRTEYALMGECIVALERIVAQKPRRGRPPKWMTAAKTPDSTQDSKMETTVKHRAVRRGKRAGAKK
jgi:hypothetical protein